jgi:MSHA biogenesis protein MshL
MTKISTWKNQLTATAQLICVTALLSSCGTSMPERPVEARHIVQADTERSAALNDGIPLVVNTLMPTIISEPEDVFVDRFSVVVQNVDVQEILFALARDADINIDVSPDVTGLISINAIDQTVFQILDRISRQARLRWRRNDDGLLIVENDTPFVRSYDIDYVNVARDASNQISVSTSIVSVGGSGGQSGGGTNNSVSALTQVSANNLWESLETNLRAILEEEGSTGDSAVMISRESGVITVRATERQHQDVFSFINRVMRRALAQVLIEATVVEVTLSDDFQSGVDWLTVSRNSGQFDFLQTVTGLNISDNPATIMTIDRTSTPDAIAATIRLLSQFGELKVLSSPKIMALNNQAAMLRVVDNRVYFTIEVEAGSPSTATSAGTQPTYTSTVQTVPTGFVMSVTPQVSDSEVVTLNVRPTISRVVRFVNDPNPLLATAGVVNAIPEIQIREIESILKVSSGQIAVLGGLMQDSLETQIQGTPFLSRLPGFGPLFSYNRETNRKTELIVFIRPVVISERTDPNQLASYQEFLPVSGGQMSSQSRENSALTGNNSRDRQGRR